MRQRLREDSKQLGDPSTTGTVRAQPATELRHALGLRHSGVHITCDLLLDLIADPAAGTWRWKDEYEQIRRSGFVSDDEDQRVQSARRRAFALVEAGRGPFAEDWTSFRVPPDWPLPTLPPEALSGGNSAR